MLRVYEPVNGHEFDGLWASDDPATTAVFCAVREGQFDSLRKLLASGIPVDVQSKEGFTPLMAAVWDNHLEMMEALLKAGANVNAKSNSGYTALILACTHDEYTNLLAKLINTIEVVEPEQGVEDAIAERNLKIIKALIAAGADVNAQETETGLTALFSAVSFRNKDAVRTLIEAGADVNVNSMMTPPGITPLIQAANAGEPEIADMLIAAKARTAGKV